MATQVIPMLVHTHGCHRLEEEFTMWLFEPDRVFFSKHFNIARMSAVYHPHLLAADPRLHVCLFPQGNIHI